MTDAGAEPLVVAGTGSWGVVLAVHAAARGTPTVLLARGEDEARQLIERGESPRVPGVRFPSGLRVSADPSDVARGRVLLLVVPAQSMRANATALAPHITGEHIVVSASKGLEIATTSRMSEVIQEVIPQLPGGPSPGDRIFRSTV